MTNGGAMAVGGLPVEAAALDVRHLGGEPRHQRGPLAVHRIVTRARACGQARGCVTPEDERRHEEVEVPR